MFGKMKARCNFIVLLLGFLAACTRPSQVPELEVAEQSRSIEEPSPALVAVDSLLWRQPDSALVCLLPCFDTLSAMTEHDRHYAHLLLSELLYKNYYEQTNRAELLQAESYFDSLVRQQRPPFKGVPARAGDSKNATQTHTFLSARAHYMDGVGHYERDSLVPACREYMKALEIMEDRFDEKDLTGHKALFMAYAFSRLMEVYSDLYLHEQTIFFARQSLSYFHLFGLSSAPLSSLLNEIGSQYEMMEQFDSADYYYCRAIAVLGDTNSLLYRDIAFHQTYLDYKKGGCQADVALSRLHRLLSRSETETERQARCLSIGELYYSNRLYDSAKVYLESVYYGNTSVNSKKQAAEWLVDVCKAIGEGAETLEYASYLVPFSNLEENNKSETKSQLAELYKGFEIEKLKHSHQLERKKNLKWTLAAIVCLLVVLLAVAILNHHNKTSKQLLESQIRDEHYAHEMQQKALSGKLKKSNEALRDAKERIGKLNKKGVQKQPTRTKDYSSFTDTPICSQILDTVKKHKFKSKTNYWVYKEFALQKEEMQALRVAADDNMDNFTIRLKKRFPSLTEEDVSYCCLYLLGLSDADIAALVQRAYPTVCERKRKIRRIVGEENSLHFTLRNMP